MWNDWWLAVGRIADVLAIIAAVAAALGFISGWLTRPRVVLRTDADEPVEACGLSPEGTVWIRNAGRSRVARHLSMEWHVVDAKDSPQAGDWGNWGPPLTAELLPQSVIHVVAFNPDFVVKDSPPQVSEHRRKLHGHVGFVAAISWQRPMTPWLRTRRVVYWPVSARRVGTPPIILGGREGRRKLRAVASQIEARFRGH